MQITTENIGLSPIPPKGKMPILARSSTIISQVKSELPAAQSETLHDHILTLKDAGLVGDSLKNMILDAKSCIDIAMNRFGPETPLLVFAFPNKLLTGDDGNTTFAIPTTEKYTFKQMAKDIAEKEAKKYLSEGDNNQSPGSFTLEHKMLMARNRVLQEITEAIPLADRKQLTKLASELIRANEIYVSLTINNIDVTA